MDAARELWSAALSRWKLVMSGVLRVLGLVPFNIFVKDTGSGTECTLSTFAAHDTKLSGAVGSAEGGDTIQRELDKLKKRAHKKLMKFNN